jgi:DoxX-like family
VELTIAKILGLIALLVPNIPALIKEFAYFGFAITLVSAFIAHTYVGDSFFPFIIDPVFFLAALIVSFIYYHKTKNPGNSRILQ